MESFNFGRLLLVGIVFDIPHGMRMCGSSLLDATKKVLIEFNARHRDNVLLYVAWEGADRVPLTSSQGIVQVSRYRQSPAFTLDCAVRKAAEVVGRCAEDCKRVILALTHRNADSSTRAFSGLHAIKEETFCDYEPLVVRFDDKPDQQSVIGQACCASMQEFVLLLENL